jgi:hypothetical protein
MKKLTPLSCITAALLCLSTGNAMAEDEATPQQARSDAEQKNVTSNQENPSKPEPKENTDSKKSSGSSTTQAEPECN